MKNNRPVNVKMNICKSPLDISFGEIKRYSRSLYVDKLTEAINSDSVIEILQADKYLFNMFKIAAKKIKVKLVFGTKLDKLYIKPIVATEEFNRLILLLRYPRSINDLMANKFQLHLHDTLEKLKNDGCAHIVKEKWVLTEKGMDLIK